MSSTSSAICSPGDRRRMRRAQLRCAARRTVAAHRRCALRQPPPPFLRFAQQMLDRAAQDVVVGMRSDAGLGKGLDAAEEVGEMLPGDGLDLVVKTAGVLLERVVL